MTRRLLTAIATTSLLVLAAPGCKKDKKPDEATPEAKKPDDKDKKPEVTKAPDKPTTPAGAKTIEAADAELAKAFKAALDSCEISTYTGYIRKCKDPETKKALEGLEKKIGSKKSLLGYCYAMDDSNHVAQALAANRIGSLAYSRRMREEADEEVFKCLFDQVKKTKRERDVQALARAVTFMGTALKKDKEVIAFIDGSELDSVKRAGYYSLWANGRMNVFDHLAKVVKEGADVQLKAQVIRGFALGERLNETEEAKVCALILPLSDNDDLTLASTAASRAASSCPKDKDKVLAAADSMVGKSKFDFSYVFALRSVKGYFSNKATPEQNKKIISIGEKVLAGKFNDLARKESLRLIADIDVELGKKLAKKHSSDGSEYVRKAAENILSGQK
jgi:hypothetical protein